jgi:CHAT domain-containing protein
LIFSGGNNHWATLKENSKNVQMDDGILTAEEIAHMNLIGTNLTVLSACQTGLGEVTGEGVFGLQRSFKKAGVQSLLMSLWEVDDEATQMLMTAFYTHYAQGKTKREALMAAQQEVRGRQFMRNGKEVSGADPYFWASFILVDE